MTGTQTSHITVTCKNGGTEITRIYAVNEDALRDAQLWSNQQNNPTSKALGAWLETKGCRLDSSSGPACVLRWADGSTREEYYRDGKLHRELGPATIERNTHGTTEAYYRADKLHREDGPALVWRHTDGSTEEYYFRDGRLHRDDGPAIVRRFANGATVDKYYRDDVFVKEERLAPLSIIPGVTIRPPAPKVPGAPDAQPS